MPVFRTNPFEKYKTAIQLHIIFLTNITDELDIVTNCVGSLYTIWDFQNCLNEFKIYKVKFNGNSKTEYHIDKDKDIQHDHKLEILNFFRTRSKNLIIYSKL